MWLQRTPLQAPQIKRHQTTARRLPHRVIKQLRNTSCSIATGGSAKTSSAWGLFLEVDGAVVDIHMDGHRVAFNKAFESLGYECTSWAPPVYNDLLAHGNGTGEGLVRAYFGIVGWPIMLATSDRPRFVQKVVEAKGKQLDKLLSKDAVPLRTDIAQLIEAAAAEGATIGLLVGTLSEDGQAVAGSVLRQLGPETAQHCRVFHVPRSQDEVDQASKAQQQPRAPEPPSLTRALASAKAEAQRGEMCSFVATVEEQQGGSGSSIEEAGAGPEAGAVDASQLTAGTWRCVAPEWLSSVVGGTGVPLSRSILVASNSSVVQAGAASGLKGVVVPRRGTVRQVPCPGAVAQFEGYGSSGGCTWAALKALVESSRG